MGSPTKAYEWPGGFREGDLVFVGRGPEVQAGEVLGVGDAHKLGHVAGAIVVYVQARQQISQHEPARLLLRRRWEACTMCSRITMVTHAIALSDGPCAVMAACDRCRFKAYEAQRLLLSTP